MWISKIELTNFKSYQHAEFDFPEPTDGKNIVLIGGMNGYGKTSILEALYLCLYGKDAIAHLARAGLKADDSKGYPTFLEKAFNGEALRDGQDSMSVRVVINRNQNKALDIRRRWYFKANGTWARDEEATARDVNRGVPGTPKKDQANGFQLADLLDDQFVPAHIAPFFFFDGEEVKKLADQDRIEQVKVGLEGLLGIVLLRNLAERLRTFEASKRSEVNNVDESNIARLSELLASDKARLDELKKEAKLREERLTLLKGERESLMERITAAGGGGGDIATVKELVEEREGYRNQQREVQKRLEAILADKLPFHLMPRDLLAEFRKQLEGEIALVAWEQECRSLEPKREQFAQAFLDENARPAIAPALTDEQLAAVKARIEAAWGSLFHPPPHDCAEKIVHGYLSDTLRTRAISFLDGLAVGQQDVHDLLASQRAFSDDIESVSRKISRVEGIDRDGTLSTLKSELSRVGTEIDGLEQTARDKDREIGGLEVTYANNNAQYTREKNRLDETSPVRSLLHKSERVRAVIEEVVPQLFPLKVKALGSAMTKVYKQLAHKDQVAKIVIEPDGTSRILGKTGKEITFDRSAGENQVFATALIAGLAEVSGVRAPLVVDTPLGRLDSLHRDNIFDFWTSNPNRQVILLSQDKEIDADFYTRIKRSVGATYLLQHTDVGDGIGRTSVKPHKYFGAGR